MSEPIRERAWYRSTSLIAALAVVLVAICALAVVGVASLLRERPAPHATSATSSTPQVPASVTTSRSGCPTDTATVLNAPPKVQWQALGQMLLPEGGSTYGPCRLTAATASGYARTPGGALVAAVQIFSRATASAPVDVAVATVQQQFMANSDRDLLLQALRDAPRKNIPSDQVGRVEAYQVSTFSPDAVTVSVAYSAEAMAGQYVAMRFNLNWVDGDWRMVPPLLGTWKDTGQVLVELPGFTTWGP